MSLIFVLINNPTLVEFPFVFWVIHQEKSDVFDPDGLTLLGITPDDGKIVGSVCLERLEAFTELTELISEEKPIFCDTATIAQAAVELKDRLVDTIALCIAPNDQAKTGYRYTWLTIRKNHLNLMR